MRKTVVLPCPLRPTRPTRSRRFTAKLRSSNSIWAPKLLVTLLNWIISRSRLVCAREQARRCIYTFDSGRYAIAFALEAGDHVAIVARDHVSKHHPERLRRATERAEHACQFFIRIETPQPAAVVDVRI